MHHPYSLKDAQADIRIERARQSAADVAVAIFVFCLGAVAYALVPDEPGRAAVEVDTDSVMQVLHSLDRAVEVVPVPLLMPANQEQPRRIQS